MMSTFLAMQTTHIFGMRASFQLLIQKDIRSSVAEYTCPGLGVGHNPPIHRL